MMEAVMSSKTLLSYLLDCIGTLLQSTNLNVVVACNIIQHLMEAYEVMNTAMNSALLTL
jgi:hypothetical protein